MSGLLKAVSQLLAAEEREAVLGDLAESGVATWDGVVDVLGLVIRRQAGLWSDWRPWLAGFGLAWQGSLFLMGFSLSVSRAGLSAHPALWTLLGHLFLLLSWSWTAGFLVGSVSRRTVWVSCAFSLLACSFCLFRFRDQSLPRICLLLFLLPAVLGLWRGLKIVRLSAVAAGLLAAALSVTSLLAQAPGSQVIARELASKSFAQNKVGTSPVRHMTIYLPSGYSASGKGYPVIYFFPNGFDNDRILFERQGAQPLFDAAIAAGVINKFILVSVDMNTPIGSSWYVNSTATGNWEDFVIDELVPYIDANLKTLASRDSRGLAGDGMGGYGAIRLGMRHPEVFGAVYALHPVGTGSGLQIMYSRPNWDLLAGAKSLDDVRKDGLSMIFVSIFQAHLPNPGKPPLFIDLPARKDGEGLVVDSGLTGRLHDSFFLERMIPRYADNLKSLRGFKFDWGRNDRNQDHVYANQAFTHKLDEFGIPHEAEEYNGSWGEWNWGPDGRVYAEVLPFFRRHLVFAP